MRFVSRLLNDIDGIYWFPIIALVLFVVFFLAIVLHTWFIKSEKADEMARLPLDDDEEEDTHEESNNDNNSRK
ncbi:hypothetical protein MASR1M74_28640 [Lentimicrobium sp.]